MIYNLSKSTIGFEDQDKYVKKCISKLQKFGLDKFNAIAFRGISGALIAPVIAHSLKKEIIAVRKSEKRHSSSKVEGVGKTTTANYIIIDDLIDSGKTMRDIIDAITKANPRYNLVGIILYTSTRKASWYYKGEVEIQIL